MPKYCESIEIWWKSTSSSGVSGFAGSAGLASFAFESDFDLESDFAFGSAFASFGSDFGVAGAAGDFGVAGAAGDGAFDDLPDADFFFYNLER